MGLLSYKIFIKFDEEVDYKELEFLGNKSFNTLDFLSEKLGDNNFIEKAKSMLAEGVNKATSKLENATGSALFAQLNDKLSELKEFYFVFVLFQFQLIHLSHIQIHICILEKTSSND